MKYILFSLMDIHFYISKIDSEEEKIADEKYIDDMAKNLPQGTDKTPEVLDAALSGLSARLHFLEIMHNKRVIDKYSYIQFYF